MACAAGETRPAATAGGQILPSATRGGRLGPPSCRRRSSLRSRLSPARQSAKPAVAEASVWLVTCRRGVSLAGAACQTRPSATTGNQTLRSATRGARFWPLPVAGSRVYGGGCRRGVSLAGYLSLHVKTRRYRPSFTKSEGRPVVGRPSESRGAGVCSTPSATSSLLPMR